MSKLNKLNEAKNLIVESIDDVAYNSDKKLLKSIASIIGDIVKNETKALREEALVSE